MMAAKTRAKPLGGGSRRLLDVEADQYLPLLDTAEMPHLGSKFSLNLRDDHVSSRMVGLIWFPLESKTSVLRLPPPQT